MDEGQFAFIICSNNVVEVEECLFYIGQLHVPQGFTVDTIVVSEADSMAQGYNAAMESSTAKYKVYLHHDTFILNENFISDVLDVFREDAQVGILGVIGSRFLPDNAYAITAWNTGAVEHNGIPKKEWGYMRKDRKPVMVDALDGLILVTQYDVRWREDLFYGWDFYDISQCYEFHRKGYKAVVPYQESAWCFHDNKFSALTNYDDLRSVFIDEYQDVYPFREQERGFLEVDEYEKLKKDIQGIVGQLLEQGDIEAVCDIFKNDYARGHGVLLEYELISSIYETEKQQRASMQFFQPGMERETALNKLHHLRHLLKRIEYNKGDWEQIGRELKDTYSIYAVVVALTYVADRKKVCGLLKKVYCLALETALLEKMEKEGKGDDFEGKTKVWSRGWTESDKEELLIMVSKETDVKTLREIVTGNSDYKILVATDDDSWKQELKKLGADLKIEVRSATAREISRYYQGQVYDKYAKAVALGRDALEYVKIFQETDVPTEWFVDEPVEEYILKKLSSNIQVFERNKNLIKGYH